MNSLYPVAVLQIFVEVNRILTYPIYVIQYIILIINIIRRLF